MNTRSSSLKFDTADIVAWANLSFHERILDRLADLMLDTHDVLGMLMDEEANNLLWPESHLRKVYDEINAAMHRMTD